MALTDHVTEILASFKASTATGSTVGAAVTALANEYEVSEAAIRYHLKKHGLIGEKDPDVVMQTDKDLGIGEDDEVPAASPDLAILMANPALSKLIEQAVAARIAQLGLNAAPAATTADVNPLAAFTATIAHMLEVQAQQQPGYIKPLPAEEVDRRAAGYIEMKALLSDFEAKGTPPLWVVGEGEFFECTNAQEFAKGQKIRTYLPPAEDFIPENDEARKVHAAMLQWIGGTTPDIGEQLEAAIIASKQPPLVSGALQPANRPSRVEVVGEAPVDIKRKRVMGTLAPERHDVSLAERAAGPAGPAFATV